MSNYNAFEAFRPHFDAMARVGYIKLVPKSDNEMRNKLHDLYRVVVWILVATYNLQHLIKLVQVRHSTEQVVDILFILLTILGTLFKQLAFNVKSKRIDQMINVICGSQFAPNNSYHEAVMRENARVMLNVLRFYICCIFVCGSLWTIFPLVNRALGEEVIFTGYFPFNTEESPGFEIAVAWMNILITFQAYGNVSIDCTIVAFYAQVKVQLQCLRYNLEHLADCSEKNDCSKVIEYTMKDLVSYKDTDKGEEYTKTLNERFRLCIERHLRIKWFTNEIEDTFAEPLMFQLFIQAFVICMTVYKIVDLNLFSAEFLSMAMYLGCMLAQLFIYCYYGTQVKYESELVNQSVYFSAWMSLSPRFRRGLLIMMENLNKPIVPRTAFIVPISLETYIAILKSSYSLFAFLERSKH